MTAYEIPAEPEGSDTLWSRDDGDIVRWTRAFGNIDIGRWMATYPDGSTGRAHTWVEVLVLGPVYDQHPDVDGLPPMPWRATTDGGRYAYDVEDATGRLLFRVTDNGTATSEEDARIAAFVVRAVNAYAEQLGTGTRPEALVQVDAVLDLVQGWNDTTIEAKDDVRAACERIAFALDRVVATTEVKTR